jgi:Flp pilus assembly protein TadG
MAILTPVLVMIVLGAIDFGRAFYAYIAASSAAHEAAVYASRFPGADTTTNALATVVSAESSGFLVVGPTPTPGGPAANKPLTTSGNTVLIGPVVVADATKVPMAQVQVTYAFQPISPIPVRGPIAVSAVSAAPMTGDVLP